MTNQTDDAFKQRSLSAITWRGDAMQNMVKSVKRVKV